MDIILRFHCPLSLGFNNGPVFTAKPSQLLSKSLNINFKLHCMYHPQSSGKVERMNQTIKEILTKYTLQTGGNWTNLLSYALLRASVPSTQKNSPYTK